MNYRDKICIEFENLSRNDKGTYFTPISVYGSSTKKLKKNELLKVLIDDFTHSIELLNEGIARCNKTILKTQKEINLCGNSAKYKKAKESLKLNINIYKNDISNKENGINLYKKAILICRNILK